MDININIPAEGKKSVEELYWNIPFSDLVPANNNSIILYIRNTGSMDIKLDKLKISSDSKASVLNIYSVTGEPDFLRESDLVATNKNLGMRDSIPDVEIKACADVMEMYALGKLDYIVIPSENTVHCLDLDIIMSPDSIIAVTATELAVYSGVIYLEQELPIEE